MAGERFAVRNSGALAVVEGVGDHGCEYIEPVIKDEDKEFLYNIIKKHIEYTDSSFAIDLLNKWEESLPLFVKVMPLDYRRALEKIKAAEMQESDNPTITEEVYN